MQISPYQDEIEKLFLSVQRSSARSIALTSANRYEGVSSTAQALTHRLLLAGKSTLLVDFNVQNPSTHWLLDNIESANGIAEPGMVAVRNSELVLMGVRLDDSKALMNAFRQPDFLTRKLEDWLGEFDYVIFDTPALLGGELSMVPAETIASVCDACLLVVMTCSSKDHQVNEAIRKLNTESVNVLGCVLNDKFNPSLKEELIRELERLPSVLGWFKRYLKGKLMKNRYLAMEV